MSHSRLAVDYGSSNTIAVLQLPDGRSQNLLFDGAPLLSSAVYAERDGSIRVGRDAQRSARLEPSRYEPNPKRRIDDLEILLGERAYPLDTLAAATLRRVAQEALRVAGRPVAELTMTCPVAWGAARRGVLAAAARHAGLPAPAMVAEPVAAATYFANVLNHALKADQCLVVYDLGGGTFDTCVLRRAAVGFEVLSSGGLDDFGGVDLDGLVVEQVRSVVARAEPQAWQRLSHPVSAADRRAFRMLWDDAREAKETLSRHSTAGLHVPLADRDVHVSRPEFEQAAESALRRTADLTVTTIRKARIRNEDIAGIFLVGGSTRVPMIATMLHRAVGIGPTVLEQPEVVVATGALHAVASESKSSAPGASEWHTASSSPPGAAPASPAPAMGSYAGAPPAMSPSPAVPRPVVPAVTPSVATPLAAPAGPPRGPVTPLVAPAGHTGRQPPHPLRPLQPPDPKTPLALFGFCLLFVFLMVLLGRWLGPSVAGIIELMGLTSAAVGGFLGWRAAVLRRPIRVITPVVVALLFGLVWLFIVISPTFLWYHLRDVLHGELDFDTAMVLIFTVASPLTAGVLLLLGRVVRPERRPRESMPMGPPPHW